jgi:hypothetical protein
MTAMCTRHAELLRFYQRTIDIFSLAVSALEAGRATISKPEYERLARYVDQAHSKVDLARNELEKHTGEHGCLQSVHAAQA